MIQLVWLKRRTVMLLHERSIVSHGGLRGVRDEGLLDSALARPLNLLRPTGGTCGPRKPMSQESC